MGALGSGAAPAGPVALTVVVGHPETTAFALGVDAVLAVAAAAAIVGAHRLGRRGAHGGGSETGPPRPGLSPWRTASFLAGLVLVYVAVGSGLGAYAARPSVAVAQHVLLMMAAPPLLVLGRPGVWWHAVVRAGRRWRAGHHRWGRNGAAAGAAAAAAAAASAPVPAPDAAWSEPVAGPRRWPLGVWVLYYGSMAAFFLTPLFPRSLHDPSLLDATEIWFTAVGLAFSGFVVGGACAPGRPAFWVRIVAILAGAPVETAMGLALLLWPHPLAPGVTMATTHTAGLVLWTGGMLTSGLSLAYVLGLWVLDDSRRGNELDQLFDAALAPVSLGDGPGSGRPGPG